MESFRDIRSFPDIRTMADERKFTELLHNIKMRHNDVMPTVCSALWLRSLLLFASSLLCLKVAGQEPGRHTGVSTCRTGTEGHAECLGTSIAVWLLQMAMGVKALKLELEQRLVIQKKQTSRTASLYHPLHQQSAQHQQLSSLQPHNSLDDLSEIHQFLVSKLAMEWAPRRPRVGAKGHGPMQKVEAGGPGAPSAARLGMPTMREKCLSGENPVFAITPPLL